MEHQDIKWTATVQFENGIKENIKGSSEVSEEIVEKLDRESLALMLKYQFMGSLKEMEKEIGENIDNILYFDITDRKDKQ